ncbi:MAG: hypothetical protein U9O18_07850, partial [Chloroflexota bacterium]|nr:hypothetical protein [Chloroflexota bacterium]
MTSASFIAKPTGATTLGAVDTGSSEDPKDKLREALLVVFACTAAILMVMAVLMLLLIVRFEAVSHWTALFVNGYVFIALGSVAIALSVVLAVSRQTNDPDTERVADAALAPHTRVLEGLQIATPVRPKSMMVTTKIENPRPVGPTNASRQTATVGAPVIAQGQAPQARPMPVQARPMPVQARPMPVQARPMPVQARPMPVQARPMPVQ